jgi:hypothetical protein
VQFLIRLDAAGQYADNLLHFLHTLATPDADPSRLAVSISCGDPQRNKNYRAALYGSKKSDPVGARACARHALYPGISRNTSRVRRRPGGPRPAAFRLLRGPVRHAVPGCSLSPRRRIGSCIWYMLIR